MLLKEFKHDIVKLMRGFYGVATNGNLGPTSTLLGRNRSAISHQIRHLEEEIGVVLFERAHGRMTLTAEGLKLLKLTETTFGLLGNLHSPEFWQEEVSGHLNLRVGHATGATFLPPVLAEFSRRYPHITYDLHYSITDGRCSGLRSGAMDISIGYRPDDLDDLLYEPLFTIENVLVGPGDNRFGLPDHPSLEEIAAVPFIGLHYGESSAQRIESVFRARGFPLAVKLRCETSKLALGFVKEGMGVSIMFESVYATEKGAVRGYPLGTLVPPLEVGMILRRSGYQSPQLTAFVDFLREQRDRAAT